MHVHDVRERPQLLDRGQHTLALDTPFSAHEEEHGAPDDHQDVDSRFRDLNELGKGERTRNARSEGRDDQREKQQDDHQRHPQTQGDLGLRDLGGAPVGQPRDIEQLL